MPTKAGNNLKKFGIWFLLPIGISFIFFALMVPEFSRNLENFDEIAIEASEDFVEDNLEELIELQEGKEAMFDNKTLETNCYYINILCEPDERKNESVDAYCEALQEICPLYNQNLPIDEIERRYFKRAITESIQENVGEMHSILNENFGNLGLINIHLFFLVGAVMIILSIFCIFAGSENFMIAIKLTSKSIFFSVLIFVGFFYILVSPEFLGFIISRVSEGAEASAELASSLVKVVTLALFGSVKEIVVRVGLYILAVSGILLVLTTLKTRKWKKKQKYQKKVKENDEEDEEHSTTYFKFKK